jgi:hypothetical protein
MRRSALFLLAMPLAVVACDSTEPRVPGSLRLEADVVAVEVNDSTEIEVIVVDRSGNDFVTPPSGVTIQWSVSDPQVARVTNGYVVGLRPGSTVATASAAGLEPVELTIDVLARELEGRLSFDYSGHVTGSFGVDGGFSIHPITGPTTGDWVVTFHDEAYGSQDIIAQRTRTDGRIDLAWFLVAGGVTQPGTHAATEGVLVLGYQPALDAAEGTYLLTSGTVNFTAASATRLAGNFVLTFANSGGSAVQVTGGVFDAPVVDVESILGNSAGQPVSASLSGGAALRLPAGLLPHRMKRQ